jgi:hypothetical protein
MSLDVIVAALRKSHSCAGLPPKKKKKKKWRGAWSLGL